MKESTSIYFFNIYSDYPTPALKKKKRKEIPLPLNKEQF